MKRLLDLICCLAAIPIVGPLFLLIACLIRLEDRGPVFFTQERVGRGGKPFRCFKFRTMLDGEVTKIGRWLRMTGLDEFAQIGNIFRGEMSLIGPRPLTLEDIERIGWSLDDKRFEMLPGMSGLAQLNAGTSAKLSQHCDHYYAANRWIGMDIKLIFLSLCVNVIGKRRFRKICECVRGEGALIAMHQIQR